MLTTSEPLNMRAADPMQFVPPPDATAIPCVRIDDFRVTGRMKLTTLLRLTTDPRKTEKAKERESDYRLREAYEIRRIVQREFLGIKAKNVPKFAEYLVNVHDQNIDGLAPAIKLYCASPIIINENADGTAMAYISTDDELVAFDGETQLAAWYTVAAERPDLRDTLVPIDLSFSRPTAWARQVWHDVNAFGSRPNAALSLSMDNRDPINQIADLVEKQVPFYTGQINKLKRQVKPGEGYFTLTTFRGACVTLAKGISGVALGMKPVPGLKSEDVNHLQTVALEYFNALAGTLGKEIKDPKMLVSSPSVFVAIGALGTDLVKISDAPVRSAKIKTIMADLAEVNWAKGHHWNGIAGKVTVSKNETTGKVRSRFVVAGPKEASYNVFKALSDSRNPSYAAIRNPKAFALEDGIDEDTVLS